MSTVSATISRTSLSLAPLTITGGNPYFIDGGGDGGPSGLDIGQVVNSRIWATSAFVGGAVQVWSVPGMAAATLKMYVVEQPSLGEDQLDLEEDLATLIFAFTQPTYTLTFNIGDAIYAWPCYNADYQIDPWPMLAVNGYALGVTFDFPRSPYPTEGPI